MEILSRTRWLSGEMQFYKLEELLEFKASPPLTRYINDQGADDEEMSQILEIHRSDAPSHIMLCAFFLINHSPGSITSDDYTNLRLILGCLAN